MEAAVDIQRVGVVGGGMMGAGIIYTLSSSGLVVVFKELNENLLRRCSDQVNKMYATAFNKGKMTEQDMKKGLSSITGKVDYEGFERCDMVIHPKNVLGSRRIVRKPWLYHSDHSPCMNPTMRLPGSLSGGICEINKKQK